MIVTLLDSTKRISLFGVVLSAEKLSIEVSKTALLNITRIDGRDRSSDIEDLKAFFRAGYLRVDDNGRIISTYAELLHVLNDGSVENPNAVTSFVFRPGGVASSNVFTDWALLVAAAQTLDGVKYVYFDDSLQPTNIPAGAWDFGSNGYTIWHGKPTGQGVSLVTFEDGAEVVGVYEFYLLSMVSVSSQPALVQRGVTSSGFYYLGKHSSMSAQGSAAFFANLTNQMAYWIIRDDASLRSSLSAVLQAQSRNSSVTVMAYDAATVDVDTLRALPNAGISGLVVHPTARIATSHFGRTVVVNYMMPAHRYGTGSPEGVLAGEVGEIYVDTAGGKGTTLYVKEADPGLNTGWGVK